MVQFNKYADKTAGGIETHSTPFDAPEFDSPNWATHIREWGKSPGGVIVPAQFDEYGNKKVAISKNEMSHFGATEAERPAANTVPVGAAYMAVNTQQIWQSNGTDWVVLA